MKLLNNKIFIFFSIGLNIGFIIFIAYHLITLPGPRSERALKSAIKALEYAKVEKDVRNDVIAEVKNLNSEIGKIYSEIHEKRLEIIKIYSMEKRDYKKLKKLEKEIVLITNVKDKIFSSHVTKLDSILQDKAPAYFQSIYNDVKVLFDRKR